MNNFKLKPTQPERAGETRQGHRIQTSSSQQEKLEIPRQSNLDPTVVSRKLQLASDLFEMSFKTKQYQIKKRFPQLSDLEVDQEAYRLIEKGCQ